MRRRTFLSSLPAGALLAGAGSVAAHLVAAQRGAMLLRVHDVAATVDALKVWAAVDAVPMPRVDAAPTMPRWPDDV